MKIILKKRKKSRRLRTALLISSCLIILLCSFFLLFPGIGKALVRSIFSGRTVPGPLEGPYPVVYVFDGDTIAVTIEGKEVTVRMIGIDTPESVNRDQSRNSPEGLEASLWLHSRLKGRQVFLEYDEQRTDRYGRDLVYVWLEDGVTMIEDELLKNGMAVTLPMEPNTRYSVRFAEIERQAVKENAGFWGTGFFSKN